jgi:AraC family transcriptional regulator of adaptative response/methylated-DNA-[protein]-cysteine methyltransferase
MTVTPPSPVQGGLSSARAAQDYARVEAAIRYLDTHHEEQPDLGTLAAEIGLSPFHFQRLFQRWAGVSPKRFLQFLTVDHARRMLDAGASVLDAALDSGLSGPSRLHDLFVASEAVTPGEAKSGGAGVEIAYGFHASPFGACLIGATPRGVCWLAFVREDGQEAALAKLRQRWPGADLREDRRATAVLAQRAFGTARQDGPLPIHLRGTNFQLRVWEALLRIPPGTALAYSDLARAIGRPGAERAVGMAAGRNPIAFLVPCHRVIRKTGPFSGYAWGAERKRAILGWESARHGVAPDEETIHEAAVPLG